METLKYITEIMLVKKISVFIFSNVTFNKLLAGIFLSVIFILNPNNLYHSYGNGNGKYEDSGDSFSESLVRNSIIDNISNNGRYFFGGVITTGKSPDDYLYHPNGIRYYYTSPILQSLFLTKIYTFFDISLINANQFFSFFRNLAAIALAFVLVYLSAFLLSRIGVDFKLWVSFLIVVLFGGSFGFVIFAKNLYFLIFVYFLPALALLFVFKTKFGRYLGYIAFFCVSLIVFLRGYEFAAIPLLLAFLVRWYQIENSTLRQKILSLTALSLVYIFAFVMSHLIHIYLLLDFQVVSSIAEAFKLKFESFETRVMTFEPSPFSEKFYAYFNGFFSTVAYFFYIVRFSGNDILYAYFLLIVFVVLFKKSSPLRPVVIFGISSFLLSYLSAYEHLISHGFMYSWLIFSFSLFFSLAIAIPYLLNFLFKYFRSGFILLLDNLRSKKNI